MLLVSLHKHSMSASLLLLFSFFFLGAETACNSTRSRPRVVPSKEDAQLKVVVPNIPPQSFRQLVNCSDPSNVSGFCIDVFETALSMLPDYLAFTTISYTCFNFSLRPNSTNETLNYNDMIDAVANGTYDVAVGDVTMTANRANKVLFTQEYMNSGVVIITKITNDISTWSEWYLFAQPFTWLLWGMIVGAFILIAAILWYVEHRANPQHRSLPRFLMESLVLFERESIKTQVGEFTMSAWVFVVVLLAASYTAGLSSILTVDNLSPTIVNILSLRDSNSTIAYRKGSSTQDWLTTKFHIPKWQVKAIRANSEFIGNITKGPSAGGVIAIIDELPYASIMLANLSCDYGISGPQLTSEGFGFGFRHGRQRWVKEVSIAILNLRESGCLQEIQDKHKLSVADKCSSSGAPHKKISMRSVCPLVSILSLVAICCAIASYRYRLQHQSVSNREVEMPNIDAYTHWEISLS